MVISDLSASPHIDLAGSRVLHELHGKLAARGIALRIIWRTHGCEICFAPTVSATKSEVWTG